MAKDTELRRVVVGRWVVFGTGAPAFSGNFTAVPESAGWPTPNTTMTKMAATDALVKRAASIPFSPDVTVGYSQLGLPHGDQNGARTIHRRHRYRSAKGFHVDAWIEGTDSRELNRDLLSALGRVERSPRFRSGRFFAKLGPM